MRDFHDNTTTVKPLGIDKVYALIDLVCLKLDKMKSSPKNGVAPPVTVGNPQPLLNILLPLIITRTILVP